MFDRREVEGSAGGRGEQSRGVAGTEDPGFPEGLGDRRQVLRDERAGRARTGAVNGGGDGTAAASRLTRDKQGLPAVGRRRERRAQGVGGAADTDDRGRAQQVAPELFAEGIDRGRVLCVRKDAEQAGSHVEKVIERAQLPGRGAVDRVAVRDQQAPSPVRAADGPGRAP